MQNFSQLVQGKHFKIWVELTGLGNSVKNWPYRGNSER